MWMNVCCTFLLEINVFFTYKFYLRWLKSHGKLTEPETLWSTGYYKYALVEMLLCLPTQIPFYY